MWEKIKAWFKNSETIFWARLNIVVGSLWTVLSATDLAPIMNPKFLTYWLIVNGFVTEYLRRRNASL